MGRGEASQRRNVMLPDGALDTHESSALELCAWLACLVRIKSSHEAHLNVTSESSGLLTNFGSMRDPFTGCRTVSFMGFIGSQPKHVLKISAKSNVVPSFCKHDTNNKKRKRAEQKVGEENFSIAPRIFSYFLFCRAIFSRMILKFN